MDILLRARWSRLGISYAARDIVHRGDVRTWPCSVLCVRRNNVHQDARHDVRVFGLETSRRGQEHVDEILFMNSSKSVRARSEVHAEKAGGGRVAMSS